MERQYDIERFVDAQSDGVYESALAEIRGGKKIGHWIWYIFPQCEGLGHSDMSRRFAISCKAEAKEYLSHPMLGPRLTEISQALLDLEGLSAEEVLGRIDAMKVRSSMTLFAEASAVGSVFDQVLDKYYSGRKCDLTLSFLGQP